ncbi:fibrillin-2-like isoform X48, partial [Paramuricea clavata]
INECWNSCACGDGQECVNLEGSYECRTPEPEITCDDNAEEHEINGVTECFCKPGFHGNGENCTDINECWNNCACSGNEICENIPGSYLCIPQGPEDNCHPDAVGHLINGVIECFCKPGFYGSGENCTDINECWNNCACSGDEICENVRGSYTCRPGEPEDNCHPDAVGHVINGVIECFCKPGFYGSGENCTDINECWNNCACPGDEICENVRGSYTCRPGEPENNCHPDAVGHLINGVIECFCKPGFYGSGENCTDINECWNNCACPGDEICENVRGSYTCRAGEPENNCHPDAVGHLINGVIECFCKPGFYGSGENCTDINECWNNCACPGDEICENVRSSYTCRPGEPENNCHPDAVGHLINGVIECFCKPGFYGSGENCTDINECWNNCACPGDEICENVRGSYTCRPGEPENNCHPDAVGHLINGVIECFCKPGFYGSGENCTDINECWNNCACPGDEICENVRGSYTCRAGEPENNCHPDAVGHLINGVIECFCKPGFYGSGENCTDINECWNNCACPGDEICENVRGSYSCRPGEPENNCRPDAVGHLINGVIECFCKPGFYGSGENCTDINECWNNCACPGDEICENVRGSYSCRPGEPENNCHPDAVGHLINGVIECFCKPGFYGSGENCTDINECWNNCACPGDEICENVRGSYTCRAGEPENNCHPDAVGHLINGVIECFCKPGFYGSGENCTDINECWNNCACPGDEICENVRGSYTCRPGEPENNCHPDAVGHLINGVIECFCKPGFYGSGENCTDINECWNNCACPGDEICENVRGSYTCRPGEPENNCHADAVGHLINGVIECFCKPGFYGSGKNCTDINECWNNCACPGDEICENVRGSYTCRPGEPEINCHPDAVGHLINGVIECFCKPGFYGSGENCTDINECWNNCACPGDEICENVRGSYTCRPGEPENNCHPDALGHLINGVVECFCKPGFYGSGENCTDINECWNNCACPGDEICENVRGSYTCRPGEPENNCHPDAVGHLINGVIECFCKPGFYGSGENCTDIDECWNNCACPGDEICENVPGSYTCRPGEPEDNCHPDAVGHLINGVIECFCKPGFYGTGENCTDINECWNNCACSGNEICENVRGSYTCRPGEPEENCHPDAVGHVINGVIECFCKPGFYESGENCTDINECWNNCACSGDEICDNVRGSYSCRPREPEDTCHEDAIGHTINGVNECFCKSGFYGNGENCTDINECWNSCACSGDQVCENLPGSHSCREVPDVDECALGTDNCHNNATCNNTDGSFECSCNEGYSGNGTSCENIDECVDRSHDCHYNATCTDTDGSFNCSCNSGFSGNGTYCQDVDECALGTDNCHDNATCNNTDGSFECSCNQGYSGNGTSCENIDECVDRSHDCHYNATCTDTDGSFNCSCNSGFSGNGTYCQAPPFEPDSPFAGYTRYFALK